ncbi:MAG: ATP-binding cassette domain-containing protein, partial [Burkholderiaceae bacterium]
RMVSDHADGSVLMAAQGVRCSFLIKQGWFKQREFVAVDKLDLTLARGETLGIVGESGSGKSTLGMALLRLSVASTEGNVTFDGQTISDMRNTQLRPLRAQMQVVFQDPFASLSPRRTIEQTVSEGLALHQPHLSRSQLRSLASQAMREVGLSPEMMSRYPHEFSGGQRQRIAIARALVLKPALILLDEPTSSLDVSVQYQVLELLATLQQRHGIAYLFISHDLAVIRAMAHRVLVMKDGKVVESGTTSEVLSSPREAYTQRLLAAAEFSLAA